MRFGVPEDLAPERISMPIASSAEIIRSVSRERSAPWIVDGVDDRAAMISARFVMDLDPPMETVAVTGRSAAGAGQKSWGEVTHPSSPNSGGGGARGATIGACADDS